MAKFKVFQDADYVQGHLRYGHREGIIEAESKEDALNKLENEGYTDYLDLEIDDYSVYDVENGDNKFEIEDSILSYMPNDTAIVPPLTPGITFATPTKIPLISSIKNVILNPFYIIYLCIL